MIIRAGYREAKNPAARIDIANHEWNVRNGTTVFYELGCRDRRPWVALSPFTHCFLRLGGLL